MGGWWHVLGLPPVLPSPFDASLIEAERVAVLFAEEPREHLGDDLSPQKRVHALRVDERLHGTLATRGPWDLIIDLAKGSDLQRRAARVAPHLAVAGSYLARLPDAEDPRSRARVLDWADRLDHWRLATPRQEASISGRRHRREHRERQVARSIDHLVVQGDWLLIRNKAAALAIVPDSAQDAVLADVGDGRVLHTVEAAPQTSDWCFESNRPLPFHSEDVSRGAPPLSLREYDDVRCLPGQVLIQGNRVLPESFRGNAGRLVNSALGSWVEGFVLAPEVHPRPLAGTFFHLDPEIPDHFGHVLTEQFGHVWGWREALRRHPSLQALILRRDGTPLREWNLDLLEAAGISRDRITVAQGAVQVETLIATSPAYAIGQHVHPIMREVYDRAAANLAARATPRRWPERVFLTRDDAKRPCRNAAEVEATFARAGFELVDPVDYSIADQSEFVRRAKVIAGYAGSVMFHIALAGGPRRVVVLTSENYHCDNEIQISSVLGHDLQIEVGEAEVPRVGRFTAAAYTSAFTIRVDDLPVG